MLAALAEPHRGAWPTFPLVLPAHPKAQLGPKGALAFAEEHQDEALKAVALIFTDASWRCA